MRLKLLSFSLMLIGVTSIASATTLEEAVNKTIKTNPTVLSASNELKAVNQQVEQARSGYYPTIDLEVATGWESSDNPTTRANTGRDKDVHKNRDEASLRLRQMLFDGMATTYEVNRQLARVDSKSYVLDSTIQNEALDATKSYLNVLRQQQLSQLAVTNIHAHERISDQIQLRGERGVGRKADVDQSQGRLALARANMIAQEGNLLDAVTTYVRVVGASPESLSLPTEPTAQIPDNLKEAVKEGLDNHPTLKQAEADIQAANAQYDAAQSPFLPRVDFELGATANNDLDGVDGHNNDVTAMFRLRYNLLNGGKDKARSRETAHLINQAVEIRNNTHREVEQSVRLSWNAYQIAAKQYELFKLYASSAKNSRDAYQKQFNLGDRTLLDLLDSENEVFTSGQNLVNAQYDKLIAEYRLLNSMGILLKSLNIESPINHEIASK